MTSASEWWRHCQNFARYLEGVDLNLGYAPAYSAADLRLPSFIWKLFDNFSIELLQKEFEKLLMKIGELFVLAWVAC